MQFLGYAALENKSGAILRQVLETACPAIQIEWFTNLEHVKTRLLGRIDKKTLAFILASTEKDLIDLYFFEHLLRKVSLVLVLPDTECDTVALGHRLHPSFLYQDDLESDRCIKAFRAIIRGGAVTQSLSAFSNPFQAPLAEYLRERSIDPWIRPAA